MDYSAEIGNFEISIHLWMWSVPISISFLDKHIHLGFLCFSIGIDF